MSIYRLVHIDFWQDHFVLNLSSAEKGFYLYLLTNTKTSACGAYELPIKIIEFETGLNKNKVIELLKSFISYGKIAYNFDKNEILILNWLKYNNFNSPKTKTCIEKEARIIKTVEFIEYILNVLKNGNVNIPFVFEPCHKEISKKEDASDINEDKVCITNKPIKMNYKENKGINQSNAEYVNLLNDIGVFKAQEFIKRVDAL